MIRNKTLTTTPTNNRAVNRAGCGADWAGVAFLCALGCGWPWLLVSVQAGWCLLQWSHGEVDNEWNVAP